MQVPLAFLPRPEGGTAKIPRQWMEASDWFVIFTLATLLFLLGAFAAWAWVIWRRTTKPKPHIKLLMEMEETEEQREHEKRASASRDEAEPKAPWEKSADWWKRADD